ncbi:MAG: SpoIIE family protein phosphatase [Candidatus Poribacteria bacterium]|nr:SpoIIE family protein phosphatase [Candidatus Poribacteria bacterium]
MLAEQKLQFLQKTELFAELSKAALNSICDIANEVAYPAEHTIFEEGDKGDSLYLLVDGEISIIKAETEVLSFKEKGYCIGEVALIDDKPRSATIKTVTSTCLLRIARPDFYQALAREPLIGRGMFRVLNNKIRHDLEIQMSAIRKEVAQEESMRLAAEVQQSILPNEEITHPCLTSAGYCQPTNNVGGDYYDYLYLPDNRVGIFIGDVMGHGFHSAMVAAMTKSGIQTQIRFDASVPEVMKAVKRVTEEDTQAFIYMTCCYVIVHQDNRFEFANAGHPAMLLFREKSKEFIELESQFPPVGIALPSENSITQYHSTEARWEPGDLLVLYSDGITEALNEDIEMYGVERLKNLLTEKRHLPADEIRKEILSDLEVYQQDENPHDDITLVIAKFL